MAIDKYLQACKVNSDVHANPKEIWTLIKNDTSFSSYHANLLGFAMKSCLVLPGQENKKKKKLVLS